MARVAENMAFGSQTVIMDFPRSDTSNTAAGASPTADDGINQSFGGVPDQMLRNAATLAQAIDRPVWHDRALVDVARAAARSGQYARALDVTRLIPPTRGSDRRPPQDRRDPGPSKGRSRGHLDLRRSRPGRGLDPFRTTLVPSWPAC